GVILIISLDDAEHRPEDLITKQLHFGGNCGEDVRGDNIALDGAGDDLAGSLGTSPGDFFGYGLQLRVIDDRADNSDIVELISVGYRLHALSVGGDEFVIDRSLYDDAVGGHADLALVEELAHGGRPRRLVKVGGGEDHPGVVGAGVRRGPFYGAAPHRGGARGPDGRGRAGEGDQGGHGGLDEMVTDLRT